MYNREIMVSNSLELKIKKEPTGENSEYSDYCENWPTYGIKEDRKEKSSDSNLQVLKIGTGGFVRNLQRSSAVWGMDNMNGFKIKSEPVDEDVEYHENWKDQGIKGEKDEHSSNFDTQGCVNEDTRNFNADFQNIVPGDEGNSDSGNIKELGTKSEPVKENCEPRKYVDYGTDWLRYEVKEERNPNLDDSASQVNVNMDTGNFNETTPESSLTHVSGDEGNSDPGNMKELGTESELLKEDSEPRKYVDYGANWLRYEVKEERNPNQGDPASQVNVNMETGNFNETTQESSLTHVSGDEGNSDSGNMKELGTESEPMKEDSEPRKYVDYGTNWLRYEVKEERNPNQGDSASQVNVNMGTGNFNETTQASSLADANCCVKNVCSNSMPSTTGSNLQNQRNLNGLSKCNKSSVHTSNSMDTLGDNHHATEELSKDAHTEVGPFQCNICSQSFSETSQLTNHLKGHASRELHFCACCGKSFPAFYALTRHMRIHTGDKPYQCQVCKKKFTYSSNLKQHSVVHTGEKPFQCPHCEKKFARSKDVKQHLVLHTGKELHQCQVCGKKFAQSYTLKQHLNGHTGNKPHSCDVCNRTFTCYRNLKVHLRIHTKEKPYQCQVCQKEFTQSSTLKRHAKVHTKEKPYSCRICQKKFTRASHATKHFENSHKQQL